MPGRHPGSLRNKNLIIWKSLLSAALVVAVAVAILPFRREIAEALVWFGAYIAWSVNVIGQVIPQQILWFLLLLVIFYIAVGSFYGKRDTAGFAPLNADPLEGPVERLARWIEKRRRGTYFNWQIANLLGRVHRHIQESAPRGTSGRVPLPGQVQAYLDAGQHTTYADYPLPPLFGKTTPTPFDIPLEPVVDYLEENLEIKHERTDQ